MNHMEDEKIAVIEFIVAEKNRCGGRAWRWLCSAILIKKLLHWKNNGKIIVRCNLTDCPYPYIINTD